jgi:hypothetical protein
MSSSFVKLRHNLGRIYTNAKGWKTDRKIIVIESDDWGSIRMPSRTVYNNCLKAGYPVDSTEYERYDSLMSQDDLELLFDLLSKFHDTNGKNLVLTANCVVANPDFEKIAQDDFSNYYYELITDTFRKYPRHENNFRIWEEGIEKGVFFPQFHAREHLNVSYFMDALKRKDPDVLFGFKNKMPGCISKNPQIRGNPYVEATNFNSALDKAEKLTIFMEGLDLFKGLFGYKSQSIIPPNYTWSRDYDSLVLSKGVKYFQGIRKIREPQSNLTYRYYPVYLGQKNPYNQYRLVRNATFEPSLFTLGIDDPYSYCLRDISIAFKMNKPVIISSHRINYVGYIDARNRDRNLKLFYTLIKSVIKQWPDIEFMTTTELGHLLEENEQN